MSVVFYKFFIFLKNCEKLNEAHLILPIAKKQKYFKINK